MTINDMKRYILNKYPKDSSFREKVATMMPNKQIVAIYKSLVKREKRDIENSKYHQMDIFEFMVNNSQTGNNTDIKIKEE